MNILWLNAWLKAQYGAKKMQISGQETVKVQLLLYFKGLYVAIYIVQMKYI